MDRKKLLDSIRASQFAMLEVGLFLDTHPCDTEALKKFEIYRLRYRELVKEYEREYGPLSLSGDFGFDGYDWINDPWPWEKEAN